MSVQHVRRGRLAVWILLALLGLPGSPARASLQQEAEPQDVVLNVPFLPQTEALCGGAAVAMVLRYRGEPRVQVAEFATLVDRQAGGIASDVLTADVRRRGWDARRVPVPPDGPALLMAIRAHLLAEGPLILLLEERPGRYHYVVLVGLGGDGTALLHDPSWGPARRVPWPDLLRRWKATGYWALHVGPRSGEAQARSPSGDMPPAEAAQSPRASTRCSRLLDEALIEIRAAGRTAAGELLEQVSAACPDDSRPLSELAGLRFVSGHPAEAARLARDALERDHADVYAWNVLGSALFVQNDLAGALQAWNRARRPRLDVIRIEGLTRTRYALAAQALALEPGSLLTSRTFRVAERRLREMPTIRRARIAYRPDAEGYAVVDVHVAERNGVEAGAAGLIAAGLRAGVAREAAVDVAAPTGEGELWTASWRWWEHRPRAALSVAAPMVGRWPGVWRMTLSHEVQTYALPEEPSPFREVRTTGSFSMRQWSSPSFRHQATVMFDAWKDRVPTVGAGGDAEWRLADDRAALAGEVQWWAPRGRARAVVAMSGQVAVRWSGDRVDYRALGGMDYVTAAAPLALWPGADTLSARPRLLRAHPLLTDGVVSGPAFGRRLAFATAEIERRLGRPAILPVSLALFADAVHAARRLRADEGRPWHVDVGAGLRLRPLSGDGTIRLDYGLGLRDGRTSLSLSWQP